MPYDQKTYTELVELEKTSIRNRIPEADTSDGSDYDVEARVHATVVHGNQAQGAYLAKQVLPATAEQEYLEEHADRVGVPRLDAAAAAGKVALVLDSGSSGTQASGSTLQSANGIAYETTEVGTIALPAWSGKTVSGGATVSRIGVLPNVNDMQAGERIEITIDGVPYQRTIKRVLISIQAIEIYGVFPAAPAATASIDPVYSATVTVEASEAGASGNRDANDAGTLDSPSGTISATCYFLEMTGGADEQSLDDFRRNVVTAHAYRAGSGNLEDWRRWALESGVGMAEAFVYPNLRGLGAMTILPFGVADARRIGDERFAEILSSVRAQMGAFDDVDIAPLSAMGDDEHVELTVEPGVGYEPDWNSDADVFLRSSAPVSTVSTLQLNSEADLDLFQVGDRVVVPILVNDQYTTEERTIASIVNAGSTDYQLRLSTDLSSVPADDYAFGVRIWPGGPLYGEIRTALEELFDSLGPGDTVPPSRWPRVSDAYPARLTTANISCAGLGVDGVVDLNVISPAVNKVPLPLYYFRLGKLVISWL